MNLYKIAPLNSFPQFAGSGKSEILKAEILHLLQSNKEKLIQVMYRLDIAEREFLQALNSPQESIIAENLSKLILARISQIIASRKAHREIHSQSNWTEKESGW